MTIRDAVSRVLHPGDDDAKPAPDALALIKSDHAEVEALFGKALADDTKPAELRSLAATVCRLLTVHADMEEALFYPELRRKGGEEEKDSVLEADEEHGMAKDMIAKIESLRPGDETLEAKVTVLKEMVMHHVKEEESTIFKEARATLGAERLQQLGEQMQAFKERALSSGRKASTKKTTAQKKSTAKRPATRAKAGAAGAKKSQSGAKKRAATGAAKRAGARRKR
jgi:hemerythrin superfamily protein